MAKAELVGQRYFEVEGNEFVDRDGLLSLERGSERFSWKRRLLVIGGTLVFLTIGSAVGLGVGVGAAAVLTGIPLDVFTATKVSICDLNCQYTFAFGEVLGGGAGVFGAALATSIVFNSRQLF